MFATGCVNDALRNTVPSVNEPLLQLVNAVFRFCVMSGSVETQLRWGGKLCMHLIAKDIRISHAKFHCNRFTTVQYIQNYASLIFETRCTCRSGISWPVARGLKCIKTAKWCTELVQWPTLTWSTLTWSSMLRVSVQHVPLTGKWQTCEDQLRSATAADRWAEAVTWRACCGSKLRIQATTRNEWLFINENKKENKNLR